MRRTVLDSLPEDIDDPTFPDLSLKAMQELRPGGSLGRDAELLDRLRLSGFEEREKLLEVNAVLAIVALRITLNVPRSFTSDPVIRASSPPSEVSV